MHCEKLQKIETTSTVISLYGKIKCGTCGKICCATCNDKGEFFWYCLSCAKDGMIVNQKELAIKLQDVTNITDIYFDFLFLIVEKVIVYKDNIDIILKKIDSSQKALLLHLQDHWLVYHSIRGDLIAKETIYNQYSSFLSAKLRYLKSRSNLNDMDIDDLFQTIWLRVFSRLSNYNSKYRLFTWINQILRSEFYLATKSKQKYLLSNDCVRLTLDIKQYNKRNDIDNWMDNDYVSALLSVLSEREREIVVRYLLNNETQVSISKKLKISTTRTSQIYLHALEKIRANFQ